MKRILAYMLLFIMTAQVLPSSLFERSEKAIVLEKGLDAEDYIKKIDVKEDKLAVITSIHFTNPVISLTNAIHYHSPLLLSPEKDVTTPPPNFC